MSGNFVKLDKTEIIDHVLKDFKKISQAPREIPEWIEKLPRPDSMDYLDPNSHYSQKLEDWKLKESQQQYKSVDQYGNVYLVRNPISWSKVFKKDVWCYERETPVLQYTYAQALEESRKALGEGKPGRKGGKKSPLDVTPGKDDAHI